MVLANTAYRAVTGVLALTTVGATAFIFIGYYDVRSQRLAREEAMKK